MDKENIVYQQRFQNACKTVDLVVYSKSKSSLVLERNPSKFVRKCLAKEKLKSLQKDLTCEEAVMDRVIKRNIPKKIKPVGLGQGEKTSESKIYPAVNQVTWGKLLQDSSVLASEKELPQFDKLFPSCTRPRTNRSRLVNKQNKLKNDKNLNFDVNTAAGHTVTLLNPLSAKEMSKSLTDIDGNIKLATDCNSRKLKRKSDTCNIGLLQDDETAIPNCREFHSGPNKISTIDKMNRLPSDQTHSPFGESAIQLLHQLQERLKSHGDDEGFNMVSAIGAYLKTKRSENDSPASLYPTVFSTPNPIDSERIVEKEQQRKITELLQLINEQEEKIQAQASVIQELRDLSTILIEYHEQIRRKSDEDKNKSLSDKVNDVVTEVEANKDQEMLAKLSFENLTLGKKLRSQLDFILNLELECTNLRRQLKKAERLNELKGTEKSSFDNIEQKPLREESEVDSAFDEKIGSRSASGRSSVAFTASNHKSASLPRGISSKSSSLVKSNSSNKEEEPKSVVDKSVPKYCVISSLFNSAPIFKDLNSLHIENAENDTLKGKEIDSLSFISDLTSYSNYSSKQRPCLRNEANIQINDKFSTIENDKFLPALRYQYLESTHVDKGQKTGRISPSFSKPLKEIEMFSGDDSDETRVKPFSASISCDNV